MRTLCSLEGSVIASFDLILWDNSVRFPRAPNLAVSRQLLPVKLRPEHQMLVHELIFRLTSVILFCYVSLFLSAITISDAFIKSISGNHLCSLTFTLAPKPRLLQYFTSWLVDRPSLTFKEAPTTVLAQKGKLDKTNLQRQGGCQTAPNKTRNIYMICLASDQPTNKQKMQRQDTSGSIKQNINKYM